MQREESELNKSLWIPLFEWGGILDFIPGHVLDNLRPLQDSQEIFAKFHRPVRTVADVVEALHAPPENVIKSIFITNTREQVALICVNGFNRIDLKKAAHALSWQGAEILPPCLVPNYTEVPIGAISPLAYQIPPVILDQGLYKLKIVYIGSGNTCVSLMAPGRILSRLSYVAWKDVCVKN